VVTSVSHSGDPGLIALGVQSQLRVHVEKIRPGAKFLGLSEPLASGSETGQ